MKQKMWLAVEHIRNMAREGEEEERVDDGEE
jgi:hypothetical protein